MGVEVGLRLTPFPVHNPFPINPGINFSVVLGTQPSSFYFIEDRLVSSDKRKVFIAPLFIFEFRIPINHSK